MQPVLQDFPLWQTPYLQSNMHKVKTMRDENGIVTDYIEMEGDFPKYGNDDDRVDEIAADMCPYLYRTI